MKLCSAIAVIGLALSAAGPAFGNPFPWGPNDKPPMVDGITLGDSEQHVLDVLGPARRCEHVHVRGHAGIQRQGS
ncbi:MAG: hypothetical protein WDM89_04980 [Rhizomicrobium sp.]